MNQTCPFCGGTASVKDSSLIYGRSYGDALICDNFPTCNSYATLYHEGRYMADVELRSLRKQCHDVYFDPLWKKGRYKRGHLYSMMRQFLGITKEENHFGKLSKDQCRKIIEGIKNKTFFSVTFSND